VEASKRAEKVNKRSKDTIIENEAKIKDLEDESSANAEKCRNLDRALKASKR
jgi:hypothetical protein